MAKYPRDANTAEENKEEIMLIVPVGSVVVNGSFSMTLKRNEPVATITINTISMESLKHFGMEQVVQHETMVMQRVRIIRATMAMSVADKLIIRMEYIGLMRVKIMA